MTACTPCDSMYFALQSDGRPMSNLDKALAEITAIRGQMARASQFRGYGPATFAITGTLAALCAVGQAIWLKHPAQDLARYLTLWIAAAAISMLMVGVEMITRSRRFHSELADDMIRAAIEQFLPVGVAGALLTAVLVWTSPTSVWMLPGLWQIVFAMGVFASGRFLPRAMLLVGGWYLATGTACLGLARGLHALSPWAMGAPFCLGQLAMAAMLQLSHGGRK